MVFGLFTFRLFGLQILHGKDYLAQADENRTTEISVQTQRGIIYDRNGYILARNVAAYNATITPAKLPNDPGAVQEVYRQLSKYVDVPVSKGTTDEETVKAFKPCDNDLGITEIVYIADTNAPYDPVRIKCNIDQTTALKIRENEADLPGVGIEIEPVRDYPTGYLTSEIIGFLGPIPATKEEAMKQEGYVPGRDKVGYAGIEASMNDLLMGKNGKRVVEVDSAGQELRDLQEPVATEPGKNIKLTIDTRLQNIAKTALKNSLDLWNTRANKILMTNGVVIAINPKTGEILALVSEPTFENNRMARLIPAYYYNQLMRDPNHPLLNHAISAEHPPGSVFKLSASIGALNEGVVTPEQQVEDGGKITIMQKYSENEVGTPRDYVCYIYKTTGGGHGMVDFLRGLSLSCDVYFYKIGGGYGTEVPVGLNIWRLGEYARALGYNSASGIELPGEETGLIPDPNWKRLTVGENWSTGDTYIATIGQGYVLATPIQVLMSAATIANDGKYMTPTLIKEVLDSEGNVIKEFEPKLRYDLTKDALINTYDENFYPTNNYKTVQPWVIQKVKEGMRAVVEREEGTAYAEFTDMTIPSAGKTGTAEYCDNVAQAANLCQSGNWPAHAWYVGYAPYDNPEIAVVAFVYNGKEGSTVAAPIVEQVMQGYFELKSIDSTGGTGGS